MWKPKAVATIDTYRCRGLRLKPSESSVAADGSLFLLLGLNKRNHREHKPKETANASKVRKRDMYRLPSRKISRRAALHASIPLLRDDRRPSFLPSPSTKMEKLNNKRWVSTQNNITHFPCQFNRNRQVFTDLQQRFPRCNTLRQGQMTLPRPFMLRPLLSAAPPRGAWSRSRGRSPSSGR